MTHALDDAADLTDIDPLDYEDLLGEQGMVALRRYAVEAWQANCTGTRETDDDSCPAFFLLPLGNPVHRSDGGGRDDSCESRPSTKQCKQGDHDQSASHQPGESWCGQAGRFAIGL
ncbi:hypothetical protein ACWC9U_19235 [Streptomyces sp. 900116325]